MLQICASILERRPVQPTTAPDSPRSSELDSFARSIVSSMRRIPEERWNDVKTDIMLVVRNYSTPTHSTPAPFQSMGYQPPAPPAPGSSYDRSLNPGYNYPSAPRCATPGHGYFRGSSAITTSPPQNLQQPSQQWSPLVSQLPPAPQQGPQYTQLGMATCTTSPSPATVTTATTTVADTPGSGDFLGYIA